MVPLDIWARLDGQIGDGNKSDFEPVPFQVEQSGVVQAAVGDRTTLYVKNDGSLWGIGNELVWVFWRLVLRFQIQLKL